jgi:hypothetical protein
MPSHVPITKAGIYHRILLAGVVKCKTGYKKIAFNQKASSWSRNASKNT